LTSVGVLAHSGKTLGDGLGELRRTLATYQIHDPIWYEVPKSRYAPGRAKKLLKKGADLIFVWGGDGTVQRVIDAVAGAPVALAVLPAGTANLFATNLGIPKDLQEAVRIGLTGIRRRLDVGKVNGEHFGVMAGTGLDALMIRDADTGLKDTLGRFAYVWTGAKNVRQAPVKMRVKVDGRVWFKGEVSCLLVGNVGHVMGGISAFPDARPDDGQLNIGVVTASGALDWLRMLSRSAIGDVEGSPFVETTAGEVFDVRLDKALPYELDGGVRKRSKRLKFKVKPGAITVCVPEEEP
jgi:diacylglycerol kinase (ATP)